jgi:hypothetical protein
MLAYRFRSAVLKKTASAGHKDNAAFRLRNFLSFSMKFV